MIVLTQLSSGSIISNSNWTEWSTIHGVIMLVINFEIQISGKREADLKLGAQSLPELYDMKSNY